MRLKDKLWSGLQLLAVWLLLVSLAGLLSYVVYETVLIGGVWLSNSDRFRPRYWNFTRIKWLAKITGVVVVGFWIFFMAFLEKALSDWRKYNIVKRQTVKTSLLLLGSTLICLLLAQLLLIIP